MGLQEIPGVKRLMWILCFNVNYYLGRKVYYMFNVLEAIGFDVSCNMFVWMVRLKVSLVMLFAFLPICKMRNHWN